MRNSRFQRRRDIRYKQYIDKYKNIPFECYLTTLVKSKRENKIRYQEFLAQQITLENDRKKKYSDEYESRIALQYERECQFDKREREIGIY